MKKKWLFEVSSQMKGDHYWTKQEIRELREQHLELEPYFSHFWNRILHYRFWKWYQSLDGGGVNQTFFLEEQKRYAYLLEHIKGYALDQEQQKAVLTDEQNNLVLAGAGSGKSLTILGKIKYLIEAKGLPREEILVVTFTKAATKSLQHSIEQELGGTFPVYTFHQFALMLLKEANQKKSLVDDSFLEQLVDSLFQSWLQNEWFCSELVTYFLCYQKISIRDSKVKGQEEQFLLAYFSLGQIRCYKRSCSTNNLHFSTLFLPEYHLYVQFYPEIPNYLEQVEAIRTYHEKSGHLLFELFPNDFMENRLEERLNELFHTFSLVSKRCSGKDLIKQLQSSHFDYFVRLKQLLITFLHLMKANYYHGIHLEEWIFKNSKETHDLVRKRQDILLKMIREAYYFYQNQLAEQQKMDFDDLMEEAIHLIENEGLSHSYRYLIVDEYQDTSYTRYLLLRSIQKATGAKLMAVGDDWQSIYRFTGCNLNIFLNFERYFGDTEILKIQTTYRNSQELIDIAGSFVMKNPAQKKKRLKSKKSLKQPIHWLVYQHSFVECLPFLFEKMVQEQVKTVFLLGRTHRELKVLENVSFGKVRGNQFFYLNASLEIFLHTVHTSKGLEADAVILLNLEDQLLGFPSQLNDDPIFQLVSQYEVYPYEEERRLFYVALTRTKGICYCLIPKKNPSCFWKELKKEYSNHLFQEKYDKIKETKEEIR